MGELERSGERASARIYVFDIIWAFTASLSVT